MAKKKSSKKKSAKKGKSRRPLGRNGRPLAGAALKAYRRAQRAGTAGTRKRSAKKGGKKGKRKSSKRSTSALATTVRSHSRILKEHAGFIRGQKIFNQIALPVIREGYRQWDLPAPRGMRRGQGRGTAIVRVA